MTLKTAFGVALVVIGAVLAIFFWDLRFAWFQGGPIGLVLVAIGVIDLWAARRQRGGNRPRGLLQELRDDIVGPPRGSREHDDGDGPPEGR